MAASYMAHYEIFIGIWNTTGDVLAVGDSPATRLSATDTYRWLPGKKFIVHEVDARFGEDVSRSIEVMGYDLKRKRYVSRSYDDQGVSEEFEINLNRRRWCIVGDSVRFNGTFDARGNTLTGLWEMKTSPRRWQPWIQLELVKA